MIPTLPILSNGGTIVCLASGPSLCVEDVEYVRGKAVVIAINDAVRLAPWADVLYSSDRTWWLRHKYQPAFRGLKVTVNPGRWIPKRPDKTREVHFTHDVVALRNTGERGVECERNGLRTTKNSGGAAINLAVHLGAKRIILLGYDMGPHNGRKHFYDTKAVSDLSPYSAFRKLIATMVDPLKDAGIEVLNASRRTTLECFQVVALRDALPERLEACA